MRLRVPLLIFLFVWAQSARADEPQNAYDVLKKQQESREGYVDLVSEGRMLLNDASGKPSAERVFEFLQLEKKGTAPESVLIRIRKPADLAGTALLTRDAGGAAEEQWLYLPSTGKSRRIASNGRGGRFLGSEFFYEDMMPPRMDDYSRGLTGKMPCKADICYIVEEKARNESAVYSKRVQYIRSDIYQTVQTDLYDRKGRLAKQAFFENYEQIGNHWQPRRIVMQDKLTGRSTVLEVTQIALKTGLDPARLDKGRLDRP